VLDFGAGRGAVPEIDFREEASRVCGVDVDPVVTSNPRLDEAKVIVDDGKIPYPDNRFDLVYSRYVMEHLEYPDAVFSEIHRVLKPGGVFLLQTPNRLHYVSLIASITPQWFHEYITEKRGREKHTTFPTYHRVNTPRAVKRYANRAGFVVREMSVYEGRPEYLRFAAPAYLLGLVYERIVNSTRVFSAFRVGIIAVLEKP